MKTIQELSRQYPEAARQLLELFIYPKDRETLTALLGSCTCSNDLTNCTCPPEYSSPKRANYSGHTPQKKSKKIG
jgi:hypothetical protein